jgi:hypothetical protein
MRSPSQTTFQCFVCFIFAVCAFPYCIRAQSIRLQHPPYVESFVGKPKVSGNLLVGLLFGEAVGSFKPSAIGLLIAPQFAGRPVCVDISSRDGRYFAQNMYNLPAASGSIMPFEVVSAYSEQLSRYDIRDIAVTVRLVSDCNSPDEGEIIPATLNSTFRPAEKSANSPLLVTLVNAEPDRLKVSLLKNGAETAIAECKSDTSVVQISFTSSCEFKDGAALKPGSYDLLIRMHERFAWRDSHFSVRIP